MHRDGARPGRDSRREAGGGSAVPGGVARDRPADRGGARGGARGRPRPPRPEAGQHQGHAQRKSQGPRPRPRQGHGNAVLRRALELPDAGRRRDAPGRDPGHPRVHEPRAGPRKARGQEDRHLGLRMRSLRDALRMSAFRRRNGVRRHRGGPVLGAGMERASGGHAPADPRPSDPLPAEGPLGPPAGHRRRPHRDRSHAGGKEVGDSHGGPALAAWTQEAGGLAGRFRADRRDGRRVDCPAAFSRAGDLGGRCRTGLARGSALSGPERAGERAGPWRRSRRNGRRAARPLFRAAGGDVLRLDERRGKAIRSLPRRGERRSEHRRVRFVPARRQPHPHHVRHPERRREAPDLSGPGHGPRVRPLRPPGRGCRPRGGQVESARAAGRRDRRGVGPEDCEPAGALRAGARVSSTV